MYCTLVELFLLGWVDTRRQQLRELDSQASQNTAEFRPGLLIWLNVKPFHFRPMRVRIRVEMRGFGRFPCERTRQ